MPGPTCGSTPDPAGPWPVIVAATRLEALAVRRALPGARVVRSGVALSRLRGASSPLWEAAVTCGLAGAVRPGLPAGTVLVPDRLIAPDGSVRECDPALVAALVGGARRLGLEPETAPMATAAALVTGAGRRPWAERGCAGVDMEAALVPARRVASVRVVLDTPERELHPAWGRRAAVLLHPPAWVQAPWLAGEGTRCARLAAAVLAEALSGRRRRAAGPPGPGRGRSG